MLGMLDFPQRLGQTEGGEPHFGVRFRAVFPRAATPQAPAPAKPELIQPHMAELMLRGEVGERAFCMRSVPRERHGRARVFKTLGEYVLVLLFVWAKQKGRKLRTKLGTKIIESIIASLPMQ